MSMVPAKWLELEHSDQHNHDDLAQDAPDLRDMLSDLLGMHAAKDKDLLDFAQAQSFQRPVQERCRAQRQEETRRVRTEDFEPAIV